MSRTVSGIVSAPGVDATSTFAIDLRAPGPRIDEVAETLDAVASDLRNLWASALDRGDFDEVTRLLEVSHAVHVAVVSLRADAIGLLGPEPTTT